MTQFQDRPFALLGVNNDGDVQALRQLEKDGTVTWRSWWDGREPDGGRIMHQWGIRAWPTLVLIDHNGIIREAYLGSPGEKVLEEKLSKLIAEAEAARRGA